MTFEASSLPISRRMNFLAGALPLAACSGVVLGIWLPRSIWRIGDPTPLGDFSLALVLGLLVWRSVVRAGSWRRLLPVGGAIAVLLVGREVLWRMSPVGISILYGMATAIAIVTTLGGFGLQIAWARRARSPLRLGEAPLDLESLAVLSLGALVLGWLGIGLTVSLG